MFKFILFSSTCIYFDHERTWWMVFFRSASYQLNCIYRRLKRFPVQLWHRHNDTSPSNGLFIHKMSKIWWKYIKGVIRSWQSKKAIKYNCHKKIDIDLQSTAQKYIDWATRIPQNTVDEFRYFTIFYFCTMLSASILVICVYRTGNSSWNC